MESLIEHGHFESAIVNFSGALNTSKQILDGTVDDPEPV
jgi:hypothetical protein